MTETIHPPQEKATITGMKGHGFYSEHSAPQWSSIAYLHPWLQEAATTLPIPSAHTPLCFVGIGCSEGANSLKIMTELAKAAQQHCKNPIQTIYSDLPDNDYSSLMHTIGNHERPPYTQSSVFGSIVPGSMYNQLLPPHSVHMAFSFNSVAFLSQRPLQRMPGYILPNGPSPLTMHGSMSLQERKACDEQAQRDLEAFLKARAEELEAGGKLLLQSFGRNDQHSTTDGLLDSLNDALRDHVESGKVPHDLYERYYHPVYLRNLDQLLEPVTPGIGRLCQLFRVEKAECYETLVPFVEQFKQDGDAANYAKQMTGFFRAFTEAGLKGAIGEMPNANALLESIYARAEERIRQAPHLYEFHYISVAALLTRTDSKQ
ncbi:SAM dependent carboxyl methyltransferase [Pseudovibrio axinellae]|uniref:SAM dependent carboxyl methyltransferase n=1 Tax=Pseudovibrio axinellae TaxID=989403 RepID=A0A165X3J5_9HYPH|nr:hypothetical protein [Pseudovibrio axinellae]KZL17319.1 SAM dependent carboxyl methyltransferase [Pseudovibrio axinellae]SEQ20099.1 SAM dependent carboxyl methyltransferase [Pseudovibrio axinellae]